MDKLVERAGGYLKVASASLLPSVGVFGTGSGASSSNTSGLKGLWVNASLELDIRGRVRYGQAAAQADAEALAADDVYARQSLAAAVAKSWFRATEAGLQRAIVQDMVRTSESLPGLAQDRLRVGNGTDLRAVEQRQLALHAARTSLLRVQSERLAQRVNLHLALGGSFGDTTVGPVAAR